MSLFSVIAEPLTDKAPDSTPTRLTVPPVLKVRPLVLVLKVSTAAILPVLLRRTNGLVKVKDAAA